MATAAPAKAPAHLLIVGLVSLLWNGFGAFDYVMSQTDNAWYLSQVMQISDAGRAYLDAFPAWADSAWAIGVWGALVGSILLLMRSRHAFWAFVASLAGLLASTIYQYALSAMPEDMRSSNLVIVIIVWVIAIALLVYSYQMRAKGVLR